MAKVLSIDRLRVGLCRAGLASGAHRAVGGDARSDRPDREREDARKKPVAKHAVLRPMPCPGKPSADEGARAATSPRARGGGGPRMRMRRGGRVVRDGSGVARRRRARDRRRPVWAACSGGGGGFARRRWADEADGGERDGVRAGDREASTVGWDDRAAAAALPGAGDPMARSQAASDRGDTRDASPASRLRSRFKGLLRERHGRTDPRGGDGRSAEFAAHRPPRSRRHRSR